MSSRIDILRDPSGGSRPEQRRGGWCAITVVEWAAAAARVSGGGPRRRRPAALFQSPPWRERPRPAVTYRSRSARPPGYLRRAGWPAGSGGSRCRSQIEYDDVVATRAAVPDRAPDDRRPVVVVGQELDQSGLCQRARRTPRHGAPGSCGGTRCIHVRGSGHLPPGRALVEDPCEHSARCRFDRQENAARSAGTRR